MTMRSIARSVRRSDFRRFPTAAARVSRRILGAGFPRTVLLLALAISAAGCQQPVTAGPGALPQARVPTAAPPYNSPDVRQRNLPEVNPYGVPLKWPPAQPVIHRIDLTRADFATAKEYFNHLCTTEAGRRIYRDLTAEVLFDMRPGYLAAEW